MHPHLLQISDDDSYMVTSPVLVYNQLYRRYPESLLNNMQSPLITIQQEFLQAVQNNHLYLQIIYQQHDWFVLDDYKVQDIKIGNPNHM